MAVLSYHLRIQKEIERRLFLDILSFADRLRPVRDAVYIGMGSVYFEDFKAIHDRFGLERMICLEQEEWLWRRQKFNRPLSCIELSGESVDEFLNGNLFDFEGDGRQCVVWLDFDGFGSAGQQLSAFSAFLGRLRPGDVAKLTLDATYAKLERKARKAAGGSPTPAIVQKRTRKVVEDMLGREYFPRHVKGNTVASWLEQRQLARVFVEAAIVASQKGMARGLRFVPLAAFQYSDSERSEMLTVTGIISPEGDDMVENLGMGNFPFPFQGEPYRIAPLPIMTPREKMAVDQRLPPDKGHVDEIHKALLDQGVQFAEDEDESLKRLEKYAELYRYHPDYRKISP